MTKKTNITIILIILLAVLVSAVLSYMQGWIIPFGFFCFLAGADLFLLIAYTAGKDNAEDTIKEIVGES